MPRDGKYYTAIKFLHKCCESEKMLRVANFSYLWTDYVMLVIISHLKLDLRVVLYWHWQIGHMATIIIKIIIWKLELWTAHSWLKICTKSAIFWGKRHKFDASMGNNQYNLKKIVLFLPTVQRTALPLLLSILIASLVRLQTSDHDNSSSSRLLSH